MGYLGVNVYIQVQFSPGVWTDVTADVIPPTSFDYGVNGYGPNDRVADTGTLSFALDNSYQNSVAKAGAYTPGHANCRSGFELGIPIRVLEEYVGVVPLYYKWSGTIDRIEPLSAPDEPRTLIQAVDWMETAATTLVPSFDVQFNQRSDQLFTTLLAAMVNPPTSTQVDRGMETFPTAFDTARVEGVYVLGELQKICNSEMGFCYPKGDAVFTGLVVLESRRKRGASPTSIATFTALNVLSPARDRKNIIDRVQTKIHPRSFDATAVTIFTLNDKPLIKAKTSYGPIICTYKDNTQNRVRIGAKNFITPLPTTDFLFNSAVDGSGTDLTANLGGSITFHGSHAEVNILNNGFVDGYMTFLRIRGQGYYDEGEVIFESKDATHQASMGDRAVSIDMPYQSDTSVAQQAANYLLNLHNTLFTRPEVFRYIVQDDFTARQAVTREISDRITVQDTISGISNDFFINHIRHTIDKDGILTVEYALALADSYHYWILDNATFSILDSTTILAYGLWNQYWILGDSTYGVLGSTSTLSG